MKEFESFAAFYPFYLSQHRDPTCRRLHVVGSSLVLATIVIAFGTQAWWVLGALPVIGYGFAWVGHFFFEKNKPATFGYPLYSLMADWKMWWQSLTGQISDELEAADRIVAR